MTSETRTSFQVWSAIGMLAAGVALSVAGFFVPPVGEISDSVLWFFSQCLIYAGSIFGVSIYVSSKFSEIRRKLPGLARRAADDLAAASDSYAPASDNAATPADAKSKKVKA